MASWQAVLMDLDQTLIDSKQSIVETFSYAYQKVMGSELPMEQLMRVYGKLLRTQMVELAGEDRADELVRVYREHLASNDHMITVYEGWPQVLAELRCRGYALGVVTSKARAAATRHLGLHRLTAMVEVVVTADDTIHHKPDPEPFLLAAEQLGVTSERCLAVGDSPWDIVAAHRAGMTAALAEWGEYELAAFSRESAQPDIYLPTPEHLLAICPPLDTVWSRTKEADALQDRN